MFGKMETLDLQDGIDAEIEVLIDNGTGQVAHIPETNARVILSLWLGISRLRKTEGAAVLVEEILLLETEPGILIVLDRGPRVGRMWRAVRVQDL